MDLVDSVEMVWQKLGNGRGRHCDVIVVDTGCIVGVVDIGELVGIHWGVGVVDTGVGGQTLGSGHGRHREWMW